MKNDIAVGVIRKPRGSSDGITIHNELLGLQGGKPATDTEPAEYNHFNDSDYEKLKDLVYVDGVNTLLVAPQSGERGLLTAINVLYSLKSNDDINYTSATINQGIGSVLADLDLGMKTVSGGSSLVDKSFTLTVDRTRGGVAGTDVKTATYIASIPQFAGVSANADFATYASMVAGLTKIIQPSATLQKQSSPVAQYIWFISNKNNALIKDQNDFLLTQGAWGNADKEFWTKPLVLTLADGVTTATVHLYRSRTVKTFSNFTYKIS